MYGKDQRVTAYKIADWKLVSSLAYLVGYAHPLSLYHVESHAYLAQYELWTIWFFPSRQSWLEFGWYLVVFWLWGWQRCFNVRFLTKKFNVAILTLFQHCFNVSFLTKFQRQNPDVLSTLFQCCFHVRIWLKSWRQDTDVVSTSG